MDIMPSDTRDLPSLARAQVQIGPTPEWVILCPYAGNFTPKVRGTLTYLLIEQQAHAELGQTYARTVMRLETIQAVQVQSQWRLEFQPQTQSVILHSIKIRRGEDETEHVNLSRMQFLQREAGLEGCIIDGGITLLLVLEDVSVGDILEFSYTLTNRPRLLPEYIHHLFLLPAATEIGKSRSGERRR